MTGAALAIGTARVAVVLYVAALVSMTAARGWRARLARRLWTAGAVAYFVHVGTAFHAVHGWSHQAAVVETARQTQALFGVETGVGIWFNYVFTGVWGGDVAWWWLDPDGYLRRSVMVTATVHLFLAFMFFNGAVVFASGPSRWIGLAAVVLVPACWMWRRREVHP